MEFELVELLANSSFPVKIILIILVLSSLLSWVLIFEKYFTLKKSLKLSHQIEDRFWDGENIEKLIREAKERDLDELETSELVLLTVYEELQLSEKNKADIESTERLVRVIVSREDERLSKNLSILATISSSAPYIGLLGTVIGIINAFRGLSSTAQLTLSSVAPGISEALVATAVGLLAAIPALIAYNQFSKRVENILNGSLAFAEELISKSKNNAS
tara:strand:+ start:635 stop:1288 length:654 start_codon:yes stop_codon:yes gene_type:complete